MATGLKNLQVYQNSFELAMRIFEETKIFPEEEKYSEMLSEAQRIGRMIDHRINNPEKFARNW